jgi:hypothetical protein
VTPESNWICRLRDSRIACRPWGRRVGALGEGRGLGLETARNERCDNTKAQGEPMTVKERP